MYKEYIRIPYGLFVLEHDGVRLFSLDLLKEGEESEELSPLALQVKRELREYFAGTRQSFDIPLQLHMTPFQERACYALSDIPYGESISYSELATRLGNPKACRAVGSAIGKNPLPILLPCHRVKQKDGTLGGFSMGLDVKRDLLRVEGQHWKEKKK